MKQSSREELQEAESSYTTVAAVTPTGSRGTVAEDRKDFLHGFKTNATSCREKSLRSPEHKPRSYSKARPPGSNPEVGRADQVSDTSKAPKHCPPLSVTTPGQETSDRCVIAQSAKTNGSCHIAQQGTDGSAVLSTACSAGVQGFSGTCPAGGVKDTVIEEAQRHDPGGAKSTDTEDKRVFNGQRVLCRAWLAVVIVSTILVSAVLAAYISLASWRIGPPAVCRTKQCLEYARLLAHSVNTSLNPCVDFTGFVCSGWRRTNKLSVQEQWMLFDLNHLAQLQRSVDVPKKNQNTFERAAAFLRSCEAVRKGEADEMPKVKAALLEAGIVWPLLPYTVDFLRTWLYTSLKLHWSSVLHVSIRRDPNTTIIFLEPLREFFRIIEKHEPWAKDVEGARRYFETLRQEFYTFPESPVNRTEAVVGFPATYNMDAMYLGALKEATGFLSNYTDLDPAEIFGTVPGLTQERWLAELDRNGLPVTGEAVFVSTKHRFVTVFLELWKYRGELEMHLFLSWCTVQTVALYTNRRLLVNFYDR
ncbi:hypothetical protein HPB50_023076 [Hyalomma asiaticum]|uniref:Uncharacterized protein n=1 Tax=Hyalomma asiaticum TaxID=266040 RepID=A0ACB7T6G4_HYAAI|nr:hypothetical protein HPB50_023076 [Hyalomma asiaticum]